MVSVVSDSTEEKNDPRIYELGYLLVSSIPEEKVPAEVTVIKDLLASRGALFISEDFPKFRHLAYTMRKSVNARYQKFNAAYFGWVKFEIDPDVIALIQKELELNPALLRFILIKTVRESTLSAVKAPTYRAEERAPRKVIPQATGEPKQTMTTEEIDKTIEALIVE